MVIAHMMVGIGQGDLEMIFAVSRVYWIRAEQFLTRNARDLRLVERHSVRVKSR